MEQNTVTPAVMDQVKKKHDEFSEELALLQKALPYIYEDKSFDDARKVMEFLEENIAEHFQIEEHQLFSVALVIGDLMIKKLVRELQKEHIDMLGEMDMIKEIILKLGFDIKRKEVRDEFVRISKNILDMIILHARKEDEQLFPFLSARGVNTDLERKK